MIAVAFLMIEDKMLDPVWFGPDAVVRNANKISHLADKFGHFQGLRYTV